MSWAASSWEGWAAAAQDPRDASTTASTGDADEFDYSDVSAEVAGEELFNYLVCLKLEGLLSAAAVCKLAFWAKHAGCTGPVSSLALRPDSQTGKFSRKFDGVVGTGALGSDASVLYQLPMGRRLRCEAMRRWGDVDVITPLEALVEEMLEDRDSLEAELRRNIVDKKLPPCYSQHEAVMTAGPEELVHPVSLYVDGVSFSRTDSCLGIWAKFALSEKRHLLVSVKKSEVCSCGCRGWDTMYPIWDMIAWSLEHLLKGRHPRSRHDGEQFRDTEVDRAALADTELGFKALCLWIKSDIAEYSGTLGLPGHNDTVSPCPWCFLTFDDADSFFDASGLSPVGSSFPEKTFEAYERACASCETLVTLTEQNRSLIAKALSYDKAKGGSAGRALT